jgi:diaminopimelate epimerase
MLLSFTKMQGVGNDFIVFDAPADARLPDAATFRRLADRRTGIGFDQALVLQPPRQPGTDVFYRIFNADGSEVEQCGNGARCIARLVSNRRASRAGLRMDSLGGLVNARIRDDGLVSVDMGVPNFDPASLPFIADCEADLYAIDVLGQRFEIGAVSMGNPHAVLRVPSVASAPVDSVGPAMENHPRFPKRANIGFMEVVDGGHIRLRVFERGVGETLACGTGACGAVAVGRRLGLLGPEVQVDLPGGRLTVEWAGAGQPLWLTGPAETVFEGKVEVTEIP